MKTRAAGRVRPGSRVAALGAGEVGLKVDQGAALAGVTLERGEGIRIVVTF